MGGVFAVLPAYEVIVYEWIQALVHRVKKLVQW
jgi:hypothetical protein